ncbi:MAG: hypothetical protein VX693_12580 [Pseudomonadota bacterium]|nr:hypothetical protein [Pseudomonadota bacterium]
MGNKRKKNDEPVHYMERTRLYYRALGYKNDYKWAKNSVTPFSKLQKPLNEAQIAIIITSAEPGNYSDENPPVREVWSRPVHQVPETLYNQHLAWDKKTTHTRDRETYLPINAMHKLAKKGFIGSISPRIHSVPTVYSQRETNNYDAPNIFTRLKQDHADAAILVAL